MAPGRPHLRWAAKLRASAAFCLAGALAGTGLYFGNLAYVWERTTNYSGTYHGQALNSGVTGNVQLQMKENNPANGFTTGEVAWSGGLNGIGLIRGTFVANDITFKGEIYSLEGPWDLTMNCTFSGSSEVACYYQLRAVAPNSYAPQQGSLNATKP